MHSKGLDNQTPLVGKIALVTGGSRGIGRGIAIELAEAGATVYVTERKLGDGDSPTPGTLLYTAKEIEVRGGKVVPVACDHGDDAAVDSLFERIEKEQGRLDILVNNAYSAADSFRGIIGKPFWKIPESFWDDINNVGLRNHYRCSVKAAKLMTKLKSGTIINVSSAGGRTYLFSPAYGVGKAAVDRMAADCALELKPYNVAFVSLWPGPVKTEFVESLLNENSTGTGGPPVASTETLQLGLTPLLFEGFGNGESVEFTGKCVVALVTDADLIKKTGTHITTAAIGKEFGIKDVDGREIQEWGQQPTSIPYT